MENDREMDQVLMNIRNASGSIISAALISSRLSFMLLTYLMRLAKKGLIAAGFSDNFKAFTKNTEGNFTVYNIPLAGNRAKSIEQLNRLELKLQNAKKLTEKRALRNEIKELRKALPELEQLNKLGIYHCVLPKLNGSGQTIQVAVDKKSDQMFKNWFLNHLMTGLSGGEKGMEDLKVFTEGNISIFNLPFEGGELEMALSDFKTLGMNYSVLPDLKVGDGNSQIAIPNTDRSKLEAWFKMWKDKQMREGKEPGEMYDMDQESYMDTGQMEAEDYVADSDPKYQEVNEEFEKQSEKAPWAASLGKENSEEYVRFLKDKNYEKITIDKKLAGDCASAKAREMQRNGYFVSRVPYTWGENELTLILPSERVFKTNEGKTYIAFLPKNGSTLIADKEGNIMENGFEQVYRAYDRVSRDFKNVENLRKGAKYQKGVDPAKGAAPKTPKM